MLFINVFRSCIERRVCFTNSIFSLKSSDCIYCGLIMYCSVQIKPISFFLLTFYLEINPCIDYRSCVFVDCILHNHRLDHKLYSWCRNQTMHWDKSSSCNLNMFILHSIYRFDVVIICYSLVAACFIYTHWV